MPHTPEQLDQSAQTLLSYNLETATVQALLSDRGDKRVELLADSEGHQFVRRTYTPSGIRQIENSLHGPELQFPDLLDAARAMYAGADIAMVTTVVLAPEPGRGDTVVLSEYVADSMPIIEAPLATKQTAMRSLASLLGTDTEYLPQPTGMMPGDMLLVTRDETDLATLTVADIDPYIMSKQGEGFFDTIEHLSLIHI